MGCTELVEALAAGTPLRVARVERGGYAGLWAVEVEMERAIGTHGVRESRCVCVLDLKRAVARMFRWHVLRDVRVVPPSRRARLGRQVR